MSEHLAAHWRVARTAAWVGLALLVCGGHGLGQEPNPVTNGGFESVTPAGLPVDWRSWGQERWSTMLTQAGVPYGSSERPTRPPPRSE